MAVISRIEKRRHLITIEADGRRLCQIRPADFEKAPLCEGDVTDEADYLERMAALQTGAAYEEALMLLDFSARASGELRRKLMAKGFLEKAADAVLERLRQNRLVNDADYAGRVVENAKGVGLFAIRRKLKAKGVGEEALEEALRHVSGLDQLSTARRLVEQLSPRYAGQNPRQARAKLSQALARRGFSWDVISSALENEAEEEWE